MTAATFAFFMFVGVLIPLVPQYVEDELHGGELGIGLAIAVFAVVAIAVRPLIGQLVIRYGRRAVMIGGAALAAAAGSMYGFVDSLPALLVLRGLTGAGEAALFVAAMTLIADLSPPDRRAEAASYFSVAVYGGIGLGPIVGEAMLTTSGFRSTFALAGLFAVGAALVSTSVPHHVSIAGAAPVDDVETTTDCPLAASGRSWSWRRARHRDGSVRRVLRVSAGPRPLARAVGFGRAVRRVQRCVPRAACRWRPAP